MLPAYDSRSLNLNIGIFPDLSIWKITSRNIFKQMHSSKANKYDSKLKPGNYSRFKASKVVQMRTQDSPVSLHKAHANVIFRKTTLQAILLHSGRVGSSVSD